MANRGTKKSKLPENPENWTGKEFKKFLDKSLDKADDEGTVSVDRGTRQVKVKDLKKKKGSKTSSKGRYVSTGRGTGRRKL